MKKCLVTFLLGVACSAALPAEWVLLGSTDWALWEGLAGTREVSTTRGGKPAVVAAGRVTDKKSKLITFEKWYVTVEDCRAGHGKLVTIDMDGNFKHETQFVLTGGSIASSLADMLCYVVDQVDKKGI